MFINFLSLDILDIQIDQRASFQLMTRVCLVQRLCGLVKKYHGHRTLPRTMVASVCRSGSVRFLAPKVGNRQPQPVQTVPILGATTT
jgi:hypothetical protein